MLFRHRLLYVESDIPEKDYYAYTESSNYDQWSMADEGNYLATIWSLISWIDNSF